MKIRIKFSKQGPVKFIGHLDTMRYFQKAMRRADVDIKYSEGFSPHQIMSFASPLGVGLTSMGEYLDIEVNSTESSEKMVKRLNGAMAEGIEVVSYRKLGDNTKNAMSCVAAADYTLAFREKARPEDISGFLSKLEEFYKKDSITILKKTKKSEKEIDIKPMIYSLYTEGEKIFMQLAAGSAENLKPELVMDAFYQSMGMSCPEFAFQIQREEVYADIGSDDNRKLVTLEALGEEIE